MKARTGKIARLPRQVRAELNHRMADGESGKALVAWLNDLPEVKNVMTRDFAGRPILEQNLSEWRSGGYREWCSKRETIDLMRQMDEDADELGIGTGLLSDRLAKLLAAYYASLLTATAGVKDWRKPRNRELLRQMTEEVVALRRGDHSAERLRVEREHLELERAHIREMTEEGHWEWARRNVDCICEGHASNGQKIAALYKNLFGADIDDDEMEQPLSANAKTLAPNGPDAAGKTASECGDLPKSPEAAAQADQTESSPVKP